jgi:hypothetical protein
VAIDYLLTLYFAGSKEAILRYEFSPLLRYAVGHGLLIPYLLFTIFFYYGAAVLVLYLLKDEPIYGAGVAIIVLLSLTHLLGGLSWLFKNAWYSNSILALSLISVTLALATSGYVLLRRT